MAAEKPQAKRVGRPANPEGSLLSNMTDIKKLHAIAYALDLKPKATVEENIDAIAANMNRAKSNLRIFFEHFDKENPEQSKILIKQVTGKKKDKFCLIMFLKNIEQKPVLYHW